MHELSNKLNDNDNPFVSLGLSLAKEQGSSFLPLLDFVIKNTKKDINEKFFSVEYENNNYSYFEKEMKITLSSIIEKLGILEYDIGYGWDTNYPNKIFELIKNNGFDFTEESEYWNVDAEIFSTWSVGINTKEELFKKLRDSNIQSKFANPIFDDVFLDERRNICLIRHAFNQMPKDQFYERISKYQTLHRAVNNDKVELIKFLIEECNVDPNIKNEDMETPLFGCTNMATLELMSNYKINWFSQNVLGKDCLSFFTNLTDKDKSKEMVRFAQKKMSETIGDHATEDIDENYIEKRIKKNLLEMVVADKTKKELEDFIKKYKIKSFSDIFDEEGNSLAQICLNKMNWARYRIFKDHYPLAHTNKKGVGSLEIIFSKYKVTFADQALSIMKELVNAKCNEKNSKFAMNVISNFFEKDRVLLLPDFYFNSRITEGEVEPFVGQDSSKKFLKMFSDKNIKNYYGSYVENMEKEIEMVKSVWFVLLSNAVIHNGIIEFDKISVESMFQEIRDYSTGKMKPELSLPSIVNIVALFDVINENEHLNHLDTRKLWEKFEEQATRHILKSYYFCKQKDSEEKFVNSNIELIDLLLSKKSEVFSSIITKEMIEFVQSESKDLSIKMSYVFLSSEMNKNKNIQNKKSIKI
jgi:hypothetical protein